MKPSWDLRDVSKVQMNTDNVPVFGRKWDQVLSAVTDRPTDSILESLYRMQIDKSEELTYVFQVYTQEATTCAFWNVEDALCAKLLLWLLRHDLYALGPCLWLFTHFWHWSCPDWLSGDVMAARIMSRTNCTRTQCSRIHPTHCRALETGTSLNHVSLSRLQQSPCLTSCGLVQNRLVRLIAVLKTPAWAAFSAMRSWSKSSSPSTGQKTAVGWKASKDRRRACCSWQPRGRLVSCTHRRAERNRSAKEYLKKIRASILRSPSRVQKEPFKINLQHGGIDHVEIPCVQYTEQL